MIQARFETRVLDVPKMRLELVGIAIISSTALWWFIQSDTAALVVAIAAVMISVLGMLKAPRKISRWVTASLVIHVVAGMALNGYAWPYFDNVLHFSVIGSLTYLAMNSEPPHPSLHKLNLSRLQFVTAGFIFAVGIGAIWEMFEYLIDLTGFYQSQPGLTDTMMDLFADGSGGILACFYLHRSSGRLLLRPTKKMVGDCSPTQELTPIN